MSPQVLELLIFSAIAFIIINKLISILGASDEDGISPSSDNKKLKDVTNSGQDWSSFFDFGTEDLEIDIDKNLLAFPNSKELEDSIKEVVHKIRKFEPEKFIKNARKARLMIIEALKANDYDTIGQLVDKRYMNSLKDKAESYNNMSTKDEPVMKFSDITFFGNSVHIKLLVLSAESSGEEWTFVKNMNDQGVIWHLSNIDRVS
ncbi:MAG: hypothetical protein SFT93_06060 [Rickettsiaceae bacterium]|nr:hypothetical protein [Rickettsiaceae bacterium]